MGTGVTTEPPPKQSRNSFRSRQPILLLNGLNVPHRGVFPLFTTV
jgi:hypothetical protein